ncbi:MAG: hypothetical protein ABSG95_02325 [Solirubrobacteraceae bacterium]|jgi:hypothetical protein
MSRFDLAAGGRRERMSRTPSGGAVPPQRYGRYVGVLGLLVLVLITINTALTKPNGATGVPPGQSLPPFAVPLALGSLNGDANVATRSGEGAAGRIAACSVRGPQILNVCELYERGPVVLALFVNAASCVGILGDLQALAPSFPGVQFAAVAIKGDRAALRRTIRSRELRLPVGIDSDGALATLYKVASCPQVTFAYPGGVVQGAALLRRPGLGALRARVGELVAAARARGWREPA